MLHVFSNEMSVLSNFSTDSYVMIIRLNRLANAIPANGHILEMGRCYSICADDVDCTHGYL